MTCLNLNDAALARHIKQYAHANTADRIVYGPTSDADKTDIIGTGYVAVRTYLSRLPKTRAALAECDIQPAAAERIKTFTDILHPSTSDFTVLTPTKLILQYSHPKVSLRIYRSKDHLWYLDTHLLDIFDGTPELLSQKPIDACYITGANGLDAVISPVRPSTTSSRTRGPDADVLAAVSGIAL